jgi:hypothetical protein
MPPSLRRWVRTCRFSISALIFVAIAAQLNQSVFEQGRPVSNFLSFFTIQSNLIAAVALGWLAIRPADGLPSLARDQLRSSAVLYMSITGMVFALLLSDLQEELQVNIPWVNNVLHRLIPVLLVADWVLDPPSPRLTLRSAVVALIFPLAWLAYTLVRGAFVQWYPYPFLDPAQSGGYTTVAIYSLAITGGAMFILWLVVLVGAREPRTPSGRWSR